MSEETEIGTITVLIERMLNERLPRAEDILKRVNAGERLVQADIDFLEKVFSDSKKLQNAHLQNHPEYEEIVSKMAHLYKEITDKALQNEQTKK
jgi:peptidoglycan hydrolase CwlO-like protein